MGKQDRFSQGVYACACRISSVVERNVFLPTLARYRVAGKAHSVLVVFSSLRAIRVELTTVADPVLAGAGFTFGIFGGFTFAFGFDLWVAGPQVP